MKASWRCLPLRSRIDGEAKKLWNSAWLVGQAQVSPPKGSAIYVQLTAKAVDSLYFSPQARALAEAFGAKPCEKPSTANLKLLAGHIDVWRMHFEEPPDARPVFARSFLPDEVPAAFAPTEPVPFAVPQDAVDVPIAGAADA